MKKLILIFFLLAAFGMQAQKIQKCEPGRTEIVSNLAIAGIAGADTTIKFTMTEGCAAYSIGIYQTDTIETVATGARLYGTNFGGNDVQIGDTLSLAKDAATQVDYWTGTTFPYYSGGVNIKKYTVSDGDITIVLYYYK